MDNNTGLKRMVDRLVGLHILIIFVAYGGALGAYIAEHTQEAGAFCYMGTVHLVGFCILIWLTAQDSSAE